MGRTAHSQQQLPPGLRLHHSYSVTLSVEGIRNSNPIKLVCQARELAISGLQQWFPASSSDRPIDLPPMIMVVLL